MFVRGRDNRTNVPLTAAFVLAKNEEPNIGRSVKALRALGLEVTVLDSGSTDRTPQIAEALGARVEAYRYVNHVEAYRFVCVDRTAPTEHVLVLDADMIVSEELLREVRALAEQCDVVEAPVVMCWNGAPLRHGSLYPPKPIAFRGGRSYFVPSGHGERLADGVATCSATSALIHDDRKSFDAYMASQLRYAASLAHRAERGELTFRDRLRTATPLFIMATPFVSYLLRGGVLDGWSGLGYALDRLLAETVMFREVVAKRVAKTRPDDPK